MNLLNSQGTSDVALRPYRPSDLAAIVSLDQACFTPPFRFSRRAMRDFVEVACAISVVAYERVSARIVGFVVVHLVPDVASLRGHIVTLDVHPEWGRSGIGSELLTSAEDAATRAGATQMQLHVFTKNTGAIAFYQARRFMRQNQLNDFYGVGRHAFVYSKELQARAQEDS